MTSRRQLDRKFIAAVERLGRALRVASQQVATRHSLTLLQMQILEVLQASGPCRVGELAHELDVTQPTASDAVAALEAKNIVDRQRHSTDRRVVMIRLTTAGQSVAETVAADLAPLLDARRATSAENQATALQVLLEEITRLQAAGVITVNRSCLSCQHYQTPTGNDPGRCLLLEVQLLTRDLRVDCPDHLEAGGPR